MDTTGESAADAIATTLDNELLLIREAIMMVASGGSPRVVVAGLRLAGALIGPGSRLAQAAGVRLVPLWWADEAGADLAIERSSQ